VLYYPDQNSDAADKLRLMALAASRS